MPSPMRKAFGLEGDVCAMTGGGSGIGRGTQPALACNGAGAAVLGRNEAGSEAVSKPA